MSWIVESDIRDRTVSKILAAQNEGAFDYIAEAKKAFLDMAEKKGIYEESDIDGLDADNTLGHTLKQWGISWVCWQVSNDYSGQNDLAALPTDVYIDKREYYRREMESLEKQITREMLLDAVDEMSDRAGGTVRVMRG